MISFILFTIYFLSVLGCYRFVQYAHYREGGIFEGETPTWIDILAIFLPLWNTLFAWAWLKDYWQEAGRKSPEKKSSLPEMFFKPKKKRR